MDSSIRERATCEEDVAQKDIGISAAERVNDVHDFDRHNRSDRLGEDQ